MDDDTGVSTNSRTGRCLCGAIGFTVSAPLVKVLHCHCENCRRITGNFVAAARVDNAHLEVTDDSGHLKWHRFAYARYGFCGACSSTLFFVAEDSDDRTSVMIGSLDDAEGIPLGEVWFANEAQLHNKPLADVSQFDGNNNG